MSETPLQYLKGVGPKRSEALNTIGINSVDDLLQYYPRGYLDRSQIVNIKELRAFIYNKEPVTVFAEVYNKEIRRTSRTKRYIFFLTVKDETGFLTCVWFEGYKYFENAFEVGELLALSAIPSLDKLNRPQFIHPQYDRLKNTDEDEPNWGKLFNTGSIIPKYRSSADLEKVGLDSRGFRRIIRFAVDKHLDIIKEFIPEEILFKNNLMEYKSAIKAIHFPKDFNELEHANYRLKYNELFILQLLLALRKHHLKKIKRINNYNVQSVLIKQLLNSLKFDLTNSQKHVLNEIISDLQSPNIMNRLLQGDVGSGKTIVALCIALIAIENNYQVAFMAPTEILAEQHYNTFCKYLNDFNIKTDLLIGAQRKKVREGVLTNIKNGITNILIGTHAIIEDNVEFKNLSLIIVDEQHRFGVMQRAALRKKANYPDVLIMTATPIPRTLAMTLYGDLDVSIIKEMPANRKPIITAIRTEKEKKRIYQFLENEIKNGKQAYIVFPLIDESEKLDLKAATIEYENLQNIFPHYKIGLLHGKMKSDEKNLIMNDFKNGIINILVTTTIIEVGIDIPKATVMIIENAERFGLSQLHQLRGRIGRGADQSYCILIANYNWFDKNIKSKDMNDIIEEKQKAKFRLSTMVNYLDGFKIAEADLRLRGAGEFFGTKQSGAPQLQLANLIEDIEILNLARKNAFELIQSDPQLMDQKNQQLKKYFEKNYKQSLLLSNVG